MSSKPHTDWTLVVTSKAKWFHLDVRELWRYRDLVLLMFNRDLVTWYKQTILGPLWYIVQPLLTTLMFTVVFGNIAKISTDGQPKILFYLSGIILWNYFADCFKVISDTFVTNKSIFGKVYFPRIVMPLSTALSNLVKFGIQLALFVAIYIYYLFNGYELRWDVSLLLLPVLVIMAGGLSIGFGMIASSLTAKYRDITFLISFGIQLLMYGTPVIYPLSEAAEKLGEYKIFILANPMSAIIESFRYILLKSGSLDFGNLLYSLIATIVILFAGMIIFNRTEKSFIDTV
jgi:lipopolysaccharide transport system permease protein